MDLATKWMLTAFLTLLIFVGYVALTFNSVHEAALWEKNQAVFYSVQNGTEILEPAGSVCSQPNAPGFNTTFWKPSNS